MPDYSKTVIYKNTTGDDLYVGSTCNYTRRKTFHKNAIHNDKIKDYNMKLYKNIRENGCQWDMKPVLEYPCKTKLEKVTEEERVRVLLGANLNGYKCSTTKEERDEYMRLFSLNYRNGERREHLLEQKKEYYHKNKEEIRLKCKEYRSNNSEKIKQQKRESYHKNKDKINETIICECGCEVNKKGFQRHIKTKKHINLMKPNVENQKIEI